MLLYFFTFFVSVLSVIDTNSITISGISSGGYMAVQYHVAYSSTLSGAAIFAAGPYYCVEGYLIDELTECTNSIFPVPVEYLVHYILSEATLGNIDSPTNLAGQKVYLFSGTNDTTIYPAVVRYLEDMYEIFDVNLSSNFNIPAQHTFPTDSYNGNPCSQSVSPFISNCSFDGAGIALKHLYGTLVDRVTPIDSNIITFDQTKLTPGSVAPSTISLNNFGFAYIPTACQSQTVTCRLHISLHGCQQNNQTIGTTFVKNAGYNSWAESNNIIIVYPQTCNSGLNTWGCWDFIGYTSPLSYALKNAPQMKTLNNIVTYFTVHY